MIDANTLSPLVNVNVSTGKIHTITSSKGEFSLQETIGKNLILEVSHIGYQTQQVFIEIKPNMVPLKIRLQEESTVLKEVIIQTKSNSRKEKEASIVSYTVNKDFLDKNRENSLMQTLEKIPGVSTINIGSGQSKPMIRGLGFNRVAVVQNGIKHEAQQWGSDHGLEIDQYGIEKIQIIKGPISLLYGSDAIGGVIDIKAPDVPLNNTFQGNVNLLAESNNDLLGISGGIQSRKEKWYYSGRLTYRDYGDYKVPTDKINFESYIFHLNKKHLRNTAGKEANASFSIGYASDNLQSETFVSNVNAKNGFFANAHGLEVRTSGIDYDKSSRDIDFPFHKVNHFKVTNRTSITLNTHTLNVDLGFQNNCRQEYSEPVAHGHMSLPPNSKERSFNKNTYSLNVSDAFTYGPKHEVVVGINGEYQVNGIGGWGFLIPAYNRFTAGAFLYDKYEIARNIYLQAGIRYDYGRYHTESYYDWYPSPVYHEDGSLEEEYLQRAQDKILHFGSFSGSLGLSYIHKNTTFKINAGKSFRMPLANELASDGVNYHMYRYEKGSLKLDPEESYQIDVDIDHSTPNFSCGISPFMNYFDNFIYLNPTPRYFETLQIYEYTQNRVFRFGGEIRAGVKILRRLELDASGEYVHSRQLSGPKKHFTLPFSPPLSGLLSVGYQFNKLLFLQEPKLIVDCKMVANQNEIVPPENRTKGYQTFNVSLFTQIHLLRQNSPMNVKIKIKNVFDTKYFNHTSFYRLIEVPESGRNISISFTQIF